MIQIQRQNYIEDSPYIGSWQQQSNRCRDVLTLLNSFQVKPLFGISISSNCHRRTSVNVTRQQIITINCVFKWKLQGVGGKFPENRAAVTLVQVQEHHENEARYTEDRSHQLNVPATRCTLYKYQLYFS